MPLSPAANYLILLTRIGIFYLTLTILLITVTLFKAGNSVCQQTSGVPMLPGEFNFFNNSNSYGILIFCRQIDDGFMLTNKTSLTFTSNYHQFMSTTST